MAVLIIVLGWVLTFFFLKQYTNKREVVTMPKLAGLTIEQAQPLLESRNLQYVIEDSSIYNPNVTPGAIRGQKPAAGQKVKEYRTIYLSIFKRIPSEVEMPNLADYSTSLVDAELKLQNLKLKRGEVRFEPYALSGIVIGQEYKGEPIEPGESIPQGSEIVLVVGDGKGEQAVQIPNLIGKDLESIAFILPSFKLMLGYTDYTDVTDTAEAFVYKQNPEFDPLYEERMRVGEAIDVWLTNDSNKLQIDSFLLGENGDTILFYTDSIQSINDDGF